jgi:hypothetical protein
MITSFLLDGPESLIFLCWMIVLSLPFLGIRTIRFLREYHEYRRSRRK